VNEIRPKKGKSKFWIFRGCPKLNKARCRNFLWQVEVGEEKNVRPNWFQDCRPNKENRRGNNRSCQLLLGFGKGLEDFESVKVGA